MNIDLETFFDGKYVAPATSQEDIDAFFTIDNSETVTTYYEQTHRFKSIKKFIEHFTTHYNADSLYVYANQQSSDNTLYIEINEYSEDFESRRCLAIYLLTNRHASEILDAYYATAMLQYSDLPFMVVEKEAMNRIVIPRQYYIDNLLKTK